MDPSAVDDPDTSIEHYADRIEEYSESFERAAKHAFAFETPDEKIEYARIQLVIIPKKMLRWKEVWTPDQKMRESDYVNSFWGQEGWKALRQILEDIDSRCVEIRKSIQVLEQSKYYNKAQRKQSSRRLRKLLQLLQAKKQLPRFYSDELRHRLETLNALVDTLCSFSDLSFRALHKSYDVSIKSLQPGDFWDRVLSGRKGTRDFHSLCTTRPPSMWLNINLFQDSALSRWSTNAATENYDRRCYHVYRQSKDQIQELKEYVVEQVGDASTEGELQPEVISDGNFDLIDQTLKTTSKVMVASLQSERTSRFYFSVKNPGNHARQIDDLKPLVGILEASSQSTGKDRRSQRFLLSEKYKLAYQLAEFVLFLFDTQLISHLNTTNLARFILPNGDTEYLVQILPISKHRIISNQPVHTVQDDIFQLGILLVELALEKSSRPSEASIGAKDFMEVQRCMGFQYRMACEYCLSRGFPSEAQKGSFGPTRTGTDSSLESRKKSVASANLASDDASDHSIESWYEVEEDVAPSIELRRMLSEFHDEVFLRLRELYEEVETKSTPL